LVLGLGALELTEEKLRAVIDDLVRRGELSEHDAREFAAEWRNRAATQRARVQKEVETAFARLLASADIARKSDLQALADRVSALERPPAQPAPAPDPADVEC
jgi:polyhydroxyalkanoate synthesis regulator phasin